MNNRKLNKTIRNMDLPYKPRSFQLEGIRKLNGFNGRALLADDMGLGKTMQSLIYSKATNKLPALVVCPGSLKGNWADEVRLWLKTEPIIIKGQKPHALHKADVYIINYEILAYWWKNLPKVKILLLDEAHFIKNEKAQRTKAVQNLISYYKYKNFIFMTGTPYKSRPMEAFTVLNIIAPWAFDNKYKYGIRYCNGMKTANGWDFSGASRLSELNRKLRKHCMIRRMKIDHLDELPDKKQEFKGLTFNKEEKEEYKRLRTEFVEYMKEKYKDDPEKLMGAIKSPRLVQNIEMFKYIAQKKAEKALPWIESFKDNGQKLVLFCHHRAIVDYIMENYNGKCVEITGGKGDKDEAKRKFQHDPDTTLIVGTIGAMSAGHNLTAAYNVAFLEYPWTPGDKLQGESRIWRMKQENAVTVWNIYVKNTLDIKMLKTLEKKAEIFDEGINGKKSTESGDVAQLLYNEIMESK